MFIKVFHIFYMNYCIIYPYNIQYILIFYKIYTEKLIVIINFYKIFNEIFNEINNDYFY